MMMAYNTKINEVNILPRESECCNGKVNLHPFELNPVAVKGLPSPGVSLKINGWVFQSADEVIKYFSYYGKHILAGTTMAGYGYNASEYVDGSVLSRFRCLEDYFSLSEYGKGVISKDKKLIHKVERSFYHQNPLWSGKEGGEDLKESLGWYRYGKLMGVVKLIVRFAIEAGENEYTFEQLYLLGIQKGNLQLGTTLIGSREGLYKAYKDAYGLDFPIENPYPQVSILPSREKIAEFRRVCNLPPLS